MCMFSVFQCNLPTLTHTNNNVQHTACNMQHATCTLRFIDFRETMRCCFGSLLLPILFFLISVGYWWSPFISLLHYFDAPLSNMKISAVCTFFFFFNSLLLKFACIYAAVPANEAQQSKCRTPTPFTWRLCAFGGDDECVVQVLLLILDAIVAMFGSFNNFLCKYNFVLIFESIIRILFCNIAFIIYLIFIL